LAVSSPLALVVSGAPLAARTPNIARALVEQGWDVSVVATDSAGPWLDDEQIRVVTGQEPRAQQRSPDQPKAARPAVVVACPATFNTVNKLAAGIADSYATSLLCESLGAGVPIVAVPMVNDRLWPHPAWDVNLSRLRDAGVVFLDLRTGSSALAPVPSGTGEEAIEAFDPAWVVSALPMPS
jgi:phosphopantothenoylcysteine synthetase/decarboxylase